MTELEKAVEVYIDNPANYLEYQNEWEDLSDVEYVEKAFKAGANWQYEQFEKNRLTACDNMTKEEADREQEFTTDFIEKNNRIPTYSEAIEYGRNIASEQAMKYLHEHHSPSEVSDFQAAMNIAVAKAIDSTINKACEWLENNLSQEVSVISGGYVHINFENSIKEFRKALEE